MVCALLALSLGVLAVDWGQTASWDLRNYHLYGAWAWLHGRAAFDLVPAQLQSFYNPLLQVPIYWLLIETPPALSSFLLGALQALNFIPLYLIARRLAGPATPRWLPLLAAVCGATGATQLGELGATQGDNLVSLPFLAGLAVLLHARQDAMGKRRRLVLQLGGGLLLGAATGLKLTLAPLAFGVFLALPLLSGLRAAPQLLALVGIGAALGGLATWGPWMWELWQRYGNPFHPMLGGVFESRWSLPFPARDMRFLPDGLLETLAYPYLWLVDPHQVSELRFRDLRVPLLFTLVLVLTLWRPLQRRMGTRRDLVFLLVSFALGYLAWLALFGYYRYLSVWEMLAPAMLLAAWLRLVRPGRGTRAGIATLLVVVTLGSNPPEWGRVQAQGERFLQVELPRGLDYENALVAMAGTAPIAYVALAFPATTRFVRISSNFSGFPSPVHEIDREAARLLDAHAGPLLVLFQESDAAAIQPALGRLALRMDATRCAAVRSNLVHPGEPPTRLCPATRGGSAREAVATAD